ncbi:MAG TPA: hypothetical protein VGM88_11110 [Kofleriaceae bacterium]|jgi:hypothetical protein
MRVLALSILCVAACGGDNPAADGPHYVDAARDANHDGHEIDGAPDAHVDARPDAMIDAPMTTDGSSPWRHTIGIDGNDDFVDGERFATTSPTYEADVTWDDQSIFVGYHGDDVTGNQADAASEWVFVFLDADPGMGTGAATSPMYNTQTAAFPTGFGAEYYARWKTDGTFFDVQQYDGANWGAATAVVAVARAGNFVELQIPRSLVGANSAGILTYMLNETPFAEASYAGIYADNFADGYAPALPVTKYLRADFTSPLAPNDPANQAP